MELAELSFPVFVAHTEQVLADVGDPARAAALLAAACADTPIIAQMMAFGAGVWRQRPHDAARVLESLSRDVVVLLTLRAIEAATGHSSVSCRNANDN